MERNATPYQKIVFVCLNERETGVCCARGNSETIHAQLKAAVKDRGLSSLVRISRSGCLNRCGQGPNIMVFPDNIWYSGVTEADVPEILDDIMKGVVATK
jgi:(2Fe-2S) ferredoxin